MCELAVCNNKTYFPLASTAITSAASMKRMLPLALIAIRADFPVASVRADRLGSGSSSHPTSTSVRIVAIQKDFHRRFRYCSSARSPSSPASAVKSAPTSSSSCSTVAASFTSPLSLAPCFVVCPKSSPLPSAWDRTARTCVRRRQLIARHDQQTLPLGIAPAVLPSASKP